MDTPSQNPPFRPNLLIFLQTSIYSPETNVTIPHCINGHFRNLKWRYPPFFTRLRKGISPQHLAKNMVLTYLQFRTLEISTWLYPYYIYIVSISNILNLCRSISIFIMYPLRFPIYRDQKQHETNHRSMAGPGKGPVTPGSSFHRPVVASLSPGDPMATRPVSQDHEGRCRIKKTHHHSTPYIYIYIHTYIHIHILCCIVLYCVILCYVVFCCVIFHRGHCTHLKLLMIQHQLFSQTWPVGFAMILGFSWWNLMFFHGSMCHGEIPQVSWFWSASCLKDEFLTIVLGEIPWASQIWMLKIMWNPFSSCLFYIEWTHPKDQTIKSYTVNYYMMFIKSQCSCKSCKTSLSNPYWLTAWTPLKNMSSSVVIWNSQSVETKKIMFQTTNQ